MFSINLFWRKIKLCSWIVLLFIRENIVDENLFSVSLLFWMIALELDDINSNSFIRLFWINLISNNFKLLSSALNRVPVKVFQDKVMFLTEREDLFTCAIFWKVFPTINICSILTVELWTIIIAKNLCGLILDASIVSLISISWICAILL